MHNKNPRQNTLEPNGLSNQKAKQAMLFSSTAGGPSQTNMHQRNIQIVNTANPDSNGEHDHENDDIGENFVQLAEVDVTQPDMIQEGTLESDSVSVSSQMYSEEEDEDLYDTPCVPQGNTQGIDDIDDESGKKKKRKKRKRKKKRTRITKDTDKDEGLYKKKQTEGNQETHVHS